MKCSCCGRRRKIMESFENVGQGGDICKDCSDLLYRIQDAITANKSEEYWQYVNQVRDFLDKKGSREYKIWFEEDFMSRNKL